MRVVVANPPWPGSGYGTRSNVRWPHRRGDKVLTYPIYLAYAVSMLKQDGFQAWGIDAVDKEWGISEFIQKIKDYKPAIVFMEVSAPSFIYDLETAQKVKEEVGCIVAFCGPHMNYHHEKTIKNYNFVDITIRDEFDIIIKNVCRALSDNKPLSSVLGITYREFGRVIVNEKKPFEENLDSLPFPDRDDFAMESYVQGFYAGKKTAMMLQSRGCPARCTFCIWPQTMTGHSHRRRSPKNICDEIEYLKNKYGVDEVFFDDDTFIIDKKAGIELLDEMIKTKLNVPWMCMCRVNSVDNEVLAKMKGAGCTQVYYGFESGSQKILNSIKKGATPQQALDIVRETPRLGMYAAGSFIIGLPEDDMATINDTIKFAIKLKANYVQFVLAEALPGTEMYETAVNENLLKINSWSELDGTHGNFLQTKYLNNHELKGMLRKCYIKYYTSPSIVWENVKKVRNMNDVRKLLRGANSVLARIMYYKE
ncbi:MAG: radical SAM protein [Nanoarchaeota archaeon]